MKPIALLAVLVAAGFQAALAQPCRAAPILFVQVGGGVAEEQWEGWYVDWEPLAVPRMAAGVEAPLASFAALAFEAAYSQRGASNVLVGLESGQEISMEFVRDYVDLAAIAHLRLFEFSGWATRIGAGPRFSFYLDSSEDSTFYKKRTAHVGADLNIGVARDWMQVDLRFLLPFGTSVEAGENITAKDKAVFFSVGLRCPAN